MRRDIVENESHTVDEVQNSIELSINTKNSMMKQYVHTKYSIHLKFTNKQNKKQTHIRGTRFHTVRIKHSH